MVSKAGEKREKQLLLDCPHWNLRLLLSIVERMHFGHGHATHLFVWFMTIPLTLCSNPMIIKIAVKPSSSQLSHPDLQTLHRLCKEALLGTWPGSSRIVRSSSGHGEEGSEKESEEGHRHHRPWDVFWINFWCACMPTLGFQHKISRTHCVMHLSKKRTQVCKCLYSMREPL